MSGFYYHTSSFEASELTQKCIERIDDLPNEFTELDNTKREEISPEELLDLNLTTDWLAPNYTETVVEFDTTYPNLNEKSRKKEQERLEEEKGQLFLLETNVITTDGKYTITALIEIRGRAAGGNTEFFVEEFQQGTAELQS